MTRRITLIICSLLLVAAALVHGATTHRWSALSPTSDRATNAHAHVIRFGDYTSVDVPSELPVLERSSVTCRRYTSTTMGQAVVVSITSGPTGAVSTHTPDVCYPGSGYTTAREPIKETIDLPTGGTATYLVAEYEKKTATSSERHRIRWSWTVNGKWDIPGNPRFAFLGSPELYKMYIVTSVIDGDSGRPTADNPAVKAFVTQALTQYAELLGPH